MKMLVALPLLWYPPLLCSPEIQGVLIVLTICPTNHYVVGGSLLIRSHTIHFRGETSDLIQTKSLLLVMTMSHFISCTGDMEVQGLLVHNNEISIND